MTVLEELQLLDTQLAEEARALPDWDALGFGNPTSGNHKGVKYTYRHTLQYPENNTQRLTLWMLTDTLVLYRIEGSKAGEREVMLDPWFTHQELITQLESKTPWRLAQVKL